MLILCCIYPGHWGDQWVSGDNATDKTPMYEMPLIYVYGGWGFGVWKGNFCVLGVGILSLVFCPKIGPMFWILWPCWLDFYSLPMKRFLILQSFVLGKCYRTCRQKCFAIFSRETQIAVCDKFWTKQNNMDKQYDYIHRHVTSHRPEDRCGEGVRERQFSYRYFLRKPGERQKIRVSVLPHLNKLTLLY